MYICPSLDVLNPFCWDYLAAGTERQMDWYCIRHEKSLSVDTRMMMQRKATSPRAHFCKIIYAVNCIYASHHNIL